MKLHLALHKTNLFIQIGIPLLVGAVSLFSFWPSSSGPESLPVGLVLFLIGVFMLFAFMLAPLVTFMWYLPGELRKEGYASLVTEAARVYGVTLSLEQADLLIGQTVRNGMAPWAAFANEYVPSGSFERAGSAEGADEFGYYHYQLVFMYDEWRLLDAASDGPKELPRVDAPTPSPVTV